MNAFSLEALSVRLVGLGLALAVTAIGCGAPTAEENEEDLAFTEDELSTRTVIEAGVRLRVLASALNLRSGAGTSFPVLDVLEEGALVTTVARSGGEGWVNVRAAGGQVGWLSNKYVALVEGGGAAPTSPPSSATCAPDRGAGVVGRYQKALHDSIAFAEGTRGESKDGYNVLFSFRTVSNCQTHPNQCIRFGSTCSTAAGRYQFLTGTWSGAKSARSLGSFEPENQERAAEYLVRNVRRASIPTDRPLSAAEFANAMSKLSYEWSSLPPGRYGQPSKTSSQMRTLYCSVAGC